eukprot:TRINITY_DN3023_c0_g1_i2.p1 TRINITY_DN3023_c0_g1~~TRINITY_DN3023_c0_g1_i2.p1  ORF type:complete len:146 (-),score=24.91 TRINITY_DN3023_c0_g1_i2:105-542(-)
MTKTDASEDWSVTALAQQNIDVSKRGKHIWKVRIDRGIYQMIGVASSTLDQNEFCNHANSVGWFFYTANSAVYHENKTVPYAPTGQLPEGTVIGIHLDLDERTLSFSVDDKMLGVAVKNLPLEKFPTLTLACCLYWSGTEVTIVE